MSGKMAPMAVVAFGMIFSSQAVAEHYGSDEHPGIHRACKNPRSAKCREARKAHHGEHWGKHHHHGIHIDMGAPEHH